MALIMLTFRFEQRACVIRRQRTFQLMTISMQTLKWLDIPTSYFTLRVTNSIPLVCCASSFTVCCILSDGEAQQEGEWPTICSLLAVKHEINAVLWSEGSHGPPLREGNRAGGHPSVYTSTYSQEQEGTHYKDAEVIHKEFPVVSTTAQKATKHCCTESKTEVKWMTCLWDKIVSSEGF